jgi:hypothetical protein
VYLLDGRTAQPGGQVLAQDIVGAVAVHGGLLVSDSYQPNTNHRLLTADGLFVLPHALTDEPTPGRCGRCEAQPMRSASETMIPSGPRT